MAIQKDVTFKGVVCNYHKLWSVNAEFANGTPNIDTYTVINVEVAMYKDLATRVGSVENFLRMQTYHFYRGAVGCPTKAEIGDVYDAIKDLPEYAGAVNV